MEIIPVDVSTTSYLSIFILVFLMIIEDFTGHTPSKCSIMTL